MLFLSHRLSIGLVLNRRTLAAETLYETCNIPIVKKYNQFIVSQHKLWIPAKCSDGTRIDDNEYLESLENGKELIVCTEEQKSRNYLSILIWKDI